MKRRKCSRYRQDNKLLKSIMEAKFFLAFMALAALCISAIAQENTTDYWMTKARDFSINGSTEEAISAYDNASQIDPRNETVWIRKAFELQVLGKENESSRAYEKALSLLDEDLKNNSQDSKAWMNKGLALSGLGRQNESNQANEMALETLNNSTEKDPKNISAWRYKAEVLMRLGKWEEGLQSLNKVTEIDPKNLDAWERKGEFLTLMGRTNESIQAFDRSLELIPANDTKERLLVWMAKAQTLSYVDRKEETLKALDKVIEFDPRYVVAWSTKGFLLEDLGRHNESLAAFEEAIKIDPRDAKSWSAKASQLASLKRYNESLQAYDRTIELIPGNDSKDLASAWLAKGDALNRTGKQKEGMAAFQMAVNASDKALQKDSNDTSVLELKGRVLFKLAMYDEAIRAYDRAIETASPGSFYAPTAWIGKGNALRAQEKNEDALEAYNKAIDLSPIFAEAWAGRGEAQKALGKVTEASASFYVAKKLGYKEDDPSIFF